MNQVVIQKHEEELRFVKTKLLTNLVFYKWQLKIRNLI